MFLNRNCLYSCRKVLKPIKSRIFNKFFMFESRFSSFFASVERRKCSRNEQIEVEKIFRLIVLSTTRNGFSLLSSCYESLFLYFLSFLCQPISARNRSKVFKKRGFCLSVFLSVQFGNFQP
jgi:hypothetical protein